MQTATKVRRRGLQRWAFFVVPVAFVTLLAWVVVARTVRVRVGHEPPSFSLESFDGQRVSLDQFKGTPVVINFWASWCLPCRQEAPDLAQISRRYSTDQVVLIGINSRDLRSKAESYIEEFRLEAWLHLRDPDAAVAGAYGVPRYPETFFIDRDGILVEHWRGKMSLSQMSDRIDLMVNR